MFSDAHCALHVVLKRSKNQADGDAEIIEDTSNNPPPYKRPKWKNDYTGRFAENLDRVKLQNVEDMLDDLLAKDISQHYIDNAYEAIKNVLNDGAKKCGSNIQVVTC